MQVLAVLTHSDGTLMASEARRRADKKWKDRVHAERRKAGLCTKCGIPAKRNRSRCEKCLKYHNEHSKKYVQRHPERFRISHSIANKKYKAKRPKHVITCLPGNPEVDLFLIHVGLTIKFLRLQKRWSVETLSELAGLAFNTVYEIEKGTYSIKFRNALQIARALGVSIHVFLPPAKKRPRMRRLVPDITPDGRVLMKSSRMRPKKRRKRRTAAEMQSDAALKQASAK